MKVVLLGDACVPDDIDELGIPWLRGEETCLRPGDFAIAPFDRMDETLLKRHRLRAVMPCCGDPVASVRGALAKDVVVIGRATRQELPDAVLKLFGRVCFVKCDGRGHHDEKYVCTNNDSWYEKHSFLAEHGAGASVYFPDKREHGQPVPCKRPPRGVRSFGSEEQYKRLPVIATGSPGWLTTGLATAFRFLYETPPFPDSCLYMFRFSHWRDGRVVTPPKGMQNAFGRPPGRHSVEIERQAAEHLAKTGRVFSLEFSSGVSPPMDHDRMLVCQAIEGLFGDSPPETMIDIGCGWAAEAEYFHKKHGTRVWLVEGDEAEQGGRWRATKYGPASEYKYEMKRADLERSLAERGVAATVLSPTVASSDGAGLPKFDLVLSLRACGMHFPVAEYGKLIRTCSGARTRVVLDLNNNRKTEHVKDGAIVTAVLLTRQKSRVCEVRMLR
jgi:hypothetical protein